ncbi:hypothetical protein PCA31118_05316 [Pandoraea captiosa]|uniref:Uncharacterized protein n=1 Tax=Pandoraea captiosa TaxID=2508302 RepID=A0A5E5AX53_9BURK|nr:DUF1488 family protein [Pandoraea captiosa]VVE76863.1 hypothetical protein PCA31118_05316 [Pandoraea captiosa]
MSTFLHGGLGLGSDGESVRFNVNVDGKVWTCQIGRASLNRLSGVDAGGEALFDQFVDFEDEIVELAAKTVANGAATEPVDVTAP